MPKIRADSVDQTAVDADPTTSGQNHPRPTRSNPFLSVWQKPSSRIASKANNSKHLKPVSSCFTVRPAPGPERQGIRPRRSAGLNSHTARVRQPALKSPYIPGSLSSSERAGLQGQRQVRPADTIYILLVSDYLAKCILTIVSVRSGRMEPQLVVYGRRRRVRRRMNEKRSMI